jgi:hypothetical protein
MGQWRRFTVISWSDSNCNAPRTRRDAERRLGMVEGCADRIVSRDADHPVLRVFVHRQLSGAKLCAVWQR